MSKTPTWEELLEQIYDLEKRLYKLEKERDILPHENESFEDWLERLKKETKAVS